MKLKKKIENNIFVFENEIEMKLENKNINLKEKGASKN